MGRNFLEWREWLTAWGFHLNAQELRALGYPDPFPLMEAWMVPVFAALALGSATAIICNWHRRIALVVAFGCALYAQGVDFMSAYSLNKLFIAVYALLATAPGYHCNPDTCRLSISAAPIRIIQLTLMVQYLTAGISKCSPGDWLKYNDVLWTQVQGIHRTDLAAWMLRNLPMWPWTVMQWTALIFELTAPLLFAVRRLRPAAFILGIGFHVMIALLMKTLIFFSLQMFSFYALFVTADQWRAVGGWLGKRVSELGKLMTKEATVPSRPE